MRGREEEGGHGLGGGGGLEELGGGDERGGSVDVLGLVLPT